MDPQQRAFLEHIGLLIPKLFDAIRLGNVKSEYVLGDRIIGRRQVRLKLVAEVVDPGSNPLATHSQLRSVNNGAVSNMSANTSANTSGTTGNTSANNSGTTGNTSANNSGATGSALTNDNADAPAAPRRGPRRKHPLSN